MALNASTVAVKYNTTINGQKDHRLGLLETKLSAIIMDGAEQNAKEDVLLPHLFNVKKSDAPYETIMIEDTLDKMVPVPAGYGAGTADKTHTIGKKIFSHIPFHKHVLFTREYLDDCRYRLDDSMAVKMRGLSGAYFKTRAYYAQQAYINGESTSIDISVDSYKDEYGDAPASYEDITIDTTTYDGKALYATNHDYGKAGAHASGTQSNLFYVKLGSGDSFTAGDVAEWLNQMGIVIRQFKNANGQAQGYSADTIFLPGSRNTYKLQDMCRRALGSDYQPGGGNNDINTQAGQWSMAVLPDWDPYVNVDTNGSEKKILGEIIVNSSSAMVEKQCANLYNRNSLEVNSFKHPDTYNLHLNAYCRWGLGFANYVHTAKLRIYGNDTAAGQLVGTAL